MKQGAVYVSGLAVLAAGLALHLLDARFVRAVSSQSFDALLNATAKPPQSGRVSIIDIDEASLDELGQWPWSRHVLASLVERLSEAGASVIAFDIVFAEPDRSSPGHMMTSWGDYYGVTLSLPDLPGDETDFDRIFARSLTMTNTVLACFASLSDQALPDGQALDDPLYRGRYLERGAPDRGWLPKASSILVPLDDLYQSATTVGFINTTPDHDSIMRRTPLVMAYGPQRIYPSLSLEALRLHLGLAQFRVEYDQEGVAGVKSIGLRDLEIPTDAHGRLCLNYRSQAFPNYSAAEVLAGKLKPGELKDQIVLIGTSAAGLKDLVATPLQAEFPGVEVHATAIDNILAGDMLVEPRWAFFLNFFATALFSLVLIVLIARSRALWSFLFTVIFAGGAIVAAACFLYVYHLVLLPAEGVLTLLAVYSVVTVIKYRQEENERKKIRKMFGNMVSGDVLRFMEENPDSLSLAGRRAECTMFFSDIVGFTTIAESMPPDQLSELLNAYMTPMTRIVMDSGGYVDKFNGDAIMAVWGVPYAQDDHAGRACRAALEQLKILTTLNPQLEQRFGQAIGIRIGISSGEVTAGNMGSQDRFQYTVLGDAVNLAARLEGLNKIYGTAILIAGETQRQLPVGIITRRIDRVAVVGKSRAVDVYEVRADSVAHEFIGVYEEAWDAYAARAWDAAEKGFRRVLELQPGDQPAEVMLSRIEIYRSIPPPDNWMGAFTQKSK